MMRIIVVAGARPNFMKVAAVLHAFERMGRGSEVTLLHTGQHYDQNMSGNFFRDLELREPDVNLEIGSGSHAQQTGRIMIAFEDVCLRLRPDWVVVVGDVNSTIACALTATKMGIRVGHVEAGLRSGDRSMPEEINRLCTDAISDLLFTTDPLASANLRREGVAEEKICFVGNTMIDTLMRHVDRARREPLPEGLVSGAFGVVTLHRPSNVDNPENLCRVLTTIGRIAQRLPMVFPVHPRTRARIEEIPTLRTILEQPGLRPIEPLGYLKFIGLVAHARLVLTDSGGIQEETTFLGVPCITMRENTERPITCQMGTNVLVGSDPAAIEAAAAAALDRPAGQAHAVPEKWDGRAGERIAAALLNGEI
jgi:UDP-N-acetylglucosamine 2-epimerase (non-hydrolysing)